MKVYLAIEETNQINTAIIEVCATKEIAFEYMKKEMLKVTKLPKIEDAIIEKVDDSPCPYVYYADESKNLGYFEIVLLSSTSLYCYLLLYILLVYI